MLKRLQVVWSNTQRYPWMDKAPCFWVLLLLVRFSFHKIRTTYWPSCCSSNLVRALCKTLVQRSLTPSQLFMAAVGLLFAPLAPLVSLAAAIVFWISSWVYKYQLMFVYVTRLETGGVSSPSHFLYPNIRRQHCSQGLWNAVINRILFSAMFMQIIMIFSRSGQQLHNSPSSSRFNSYWPSIWIQIPSIPCDHSSAALSPAFQALYQ